MPRIILALAVSTLLITGCAPPENLRQMGDRNRVLQGKLQTASGEIDRLKTQEVVLRKDMAELNRVINVLDSERNSRTQESGYLRGQARKFMQGQIDTFKEFLLDSNLLDYVGGELIERANIEDKPLLIVDLANRIPKSGTLTGVTGYFAKPTAFSVKVMREVEGKLVVIWQSKLIKTKQTGVRRLNFPVVVGVEKGDVIGYFFPKNVGVTFDTGSGDTRYLSNDVRLGSGLSISSLNGSSKKRAYSIGAYGLLN